MRQDDISRQPMLTQQTRLHIKTAHGYIQKNLINNQQQPSTQYQKKKNHTQHTTTTTG